MTHKLHLSGCHKEIRDNDIKLVCTLGCQIQGGPNNWSENQKQRIPKTKQRITLTEGQIIFRKLISRVGGCVLGTREYVRKKCQSI